MNVLKLLEQSRPISKEKLLSKICVSKPYFNFQEVFELKDGGLLASFKPEQLHREGTKLALGEAMRHLAILGSCAYAKNQNEKNYYLATKASGLTNLMPEKENFWAMMQVDAQDKRSLSCGGKLLSQNGTIHEVKVEYEILTEKLFGRFFGNRKLDYQPKIFSPYTKNLPMLIIDEDPEFILAKISKFSPAKCSGHFDNYPIVPIAYLCHHLADLAVQLAKKPIIFKSFEASFKAPPVPTKPIELVVKKFTKHFECFASQDGQICNNLILKI
jgi:hypothetical protein